jgi:hypothetical protein
MVVTHTVAGRRFRFERAEVEGALREILPEPLRDHYVIVNGRRYPPKQVLSAVTGLDRADFTTHQARRILQRAGFGVGRTAATDWVPPVPHRDWPHQGREAEALRPYQGRWVAQRGLDVLVAADTPQAVLDWVSTHGVQGATVFRVPVNQQDVDAVRMR